MLLSISSVIGLAILEMGLRLSEGASGQAYSVNPTGSQYKFYMFDPKLGWANGPHMEGVYERDEFRFPIRVNGERMRDAPVRREKGDRFRIAVLGDSFTWGIGVADEDRFTERLESLYGAEVLNFGVSGYGPIQYALMMEDVLLFNPDLVIVAFCLANDFADNVLFQRYGYYKPFGSRSPEGDLEIQGYPLPNVDDFGMRAPPSGLLLVDHFASWFENTFDQPAQRGLLGFKDHFLYSTELEPEQKRLTEEAVAINEALLERVRDQATAAGVPIVIAPVPTKCEYSARCRRETDPEQQVVRRGAYETLLESAGRLGLPLIPTLDALDGRDFWEKDGHWQPSGHDRFARRIGRELALLGLMPEPKPVGMSID